METADEGLGLEGCSNHTAPLQLFIWPLPPRPFSESQALGAPLTYFAESIPGSTPCLYFLL